MADRNAQDGRATKAERRDEARRKRIEIERRMARARRNRWIAIAAAVVVVAAAGAYVFTRPEPEPTGRPAELLAAAAAEGTAAGCTDAADVGAYQPEDLDQAHVGSDSGPAEMPALSTYASQPPASGPHSGNTIGAGVYSSPPALDALIHSLEHGAAVVWYSPDAAGPEVTKILDFYRDPDVGSRVIVAPYDYPDEGAAGALPAGTSMALISWHHLETCVEPNLAAAFDFTAHWAAPAYTGQDYLGNAPEAGLDF